jgi:hypothetical protein
MNRSSWKAFTSAWTATCIGAIAIALSGCASAPKVADSMAPMIAVRLATVAAVQGDPVRAQRVVDEADKLIADIDAGQSIALDVLVPALNSRIAGATLRPAERAVLAELIAVAATVVQAPSVLPDDTRARLRLVLTWVRSAALGQVMAYSTPPPA